MRLAFLFAVLAMALYYTWVAFTSLDPLTANGRLGPGFFPRLIGVLLVVSILYSLVVDRRVGAADGAPNNVRDLVVFAGLSILFVAMLDFLGGVLAMVVFMLLALSFFNPRRHLQNVLVSVLLPAALFIMFDMWLNAGLPEGMLPFPG
jgi:putative tricarboxylic transport membrane protein